MGKKVTHIAKKFFTNKKFESHARQNEQKTKSKESQNFVSEEQEEESFSFFSSENCFEHQDFVHDFGTINHFNQNKSAFC